MPIEYKVFEAEVKAFDDQNLTVEHFISTEHKDRGGDVMRARGMKVIGKPVVLLLHGRGPMGSEPVGKPLSIEVDEFKGQPGILAKTQFYPDEVGQRLYGKAKGGFLPSWSIGYTVEEAKDLQENGRYMGREVLKWTLLEYSPVGVPMNPFAQTIKEFLDADEAGKRPEIKETPRWFGFVDEKECKECGQGCKGTISHCAKCGGHVTRQHGEDGKITDTWCEKCDPWRSQLAGVSDPDWTKEKWDEEWMPGEEKPYPGEHACRVSDPGKYDRIRRQNDKFGKGIHAIWGVKGSETELQAIRFSVEKFTAEEAKAWLKKHDRKCILFEPATGKADPNFQVEEGDGADLGKQVLELQVKITGLEEGVSRVEEAIRKAEEVIAKYKALLEALPPEPDGGEKGEEGKGNPPEPEKAKPPRLVIVREEESPEANTRAAILSVAKEAFGEAMKQEIDRMRGRVP